MTQFTTDITKLSDEDLLNKISEVRKRKIYFATSSRSNQALNQINAMESELLSVYNERQFLKIWEDNKENNSKILETDPTLAKDTTKEKSRKEQSEDGASKARKKPWSKKFVSP